MPILHTVKVGENLSNIAKHYGLRDWRVIYDYPANAAARAKRPNPNLIMPGDRFYIPQSEVKAPAAAPKSGFDITILAEGAILMTPISGLTLKIKFPNGTVKDCVTNTRGNIHIDLPPSVTGLVQLLEVADRSKQPHIVYALPSQAQFPMNASNFLRMEDRRAVAEFVATQLSISRRSAWGSRTPNYAKMEADWGYTTIAIHHSGNSGETNPTEIEHQHMDDRKYDDVGYHYMIQPNGAIYEGRYLTLKGSHVEKANTGKIGILFMGDFEHQLWDWDDDVSDKQWNSAVSLIKTLTSKFKTISRLGGHRDYKVDTECPGGELYKLLPKLRAETNLGDKP